MPIVRTPWVDDDGSGTTGTVINNAEKHLLYNQIDAYVGGTLQTWTPIDQSGAGLAFTGPAHYVRIDKLILLMANVLFPSTANGSAVRIGGLPFACAASHGGAFQAYGPGRIWWIQPGTTYLAAFDMTSGGPLTNAAMTGSNNVILGFYYAV